MLPSNLFAEAVLYSLAREEINAKSRAKATLMVSHKGDSRNQQRVYLRQRASGSYSAGDLNAERSGAWKTSGE